MKFKAINEYDNDEHGGDYDGDDDDDILSENERLELEITKTLDRTKSLKVQEALPIIRKVYNSFPTVSGDAFEKLKFKVITAYIERLIENGKDSLDEFINIFNIFVSKKGTLSPALLLSLGKIAAECGKITLLRYCMNSMSEFSPFHRPLAEIAIPIFYAIGDIGTCKNICLAVRERGWKSDIVTRYIDQLCAENVLLNSKSERNERSDKEIFERSCEICNSLRTQEFNSKDFVFKETTLPSSMAALGQILYDNYISLLNSTSNESIFSPYLQEFVEEEKPLLYPPPPAPKRPRKDEEEEKEKRRRSARCLTASSSWTTLLLEKLDPLLPRIQNSCSSPIISGKFDDEKELEPLNESFLPEFIDSLKGKPFLMVMKSYVMKLSEMRNYLWPVDLREMFLKISPIILEASPKPPFALAVTYCRIVLSYYATNTYVRSPAFSHSFSSIYDVDDKEAKLILTYYCYYKRLLTKSTMALLDIGDSSFSLSPELSAPKLARIIGSDIAKKTVKILPNEETVEKALKYGVSDEVISAALKLNSEKLTCKLIQAVEPLTPDLLERIIVPTETHSSCVLKRLLKILEKNSNQALIQSDIFWITLHRCYKRAVSQFSGQIPPAYIVIINVIHESLGKHSNCTMKGKFLKYAINELYEWLKCHDLLHSPTSSVLQSLEQAIYCLWRAAPIDKRIKSKYIVEHVSTPIEMLPEDCAIVYDVMRPTILPEFVGTRLTTTNLVSELVFQRVEKVMKFSVEKAAETLMSKLSQSYEENESVEIIESMDVVKIPELYKDLYYLIADYYFKATYIKESEPYYVKDLCVNARRFDSWAALALCFSSQLEYELCNDIRDVNEQMSAVAILINKVMHCFNCAFSINLCSHTLWMEFGSINYTIASNSSKQIKRSSIVGLDEKMEKKLLDLKLNCLAQAFEAYKRADSCTNEEHKEEWLHELMFGKIQEKNGDILRAVSHYEKSIGHLVKRGALVPRKINYGNPPFLATEILELFYRIASASLKFLIYRPNDLTVINELCNTLENIVKNFEFIQSSEVLSVSRRFVDSLHGNFIDTYPCKDSYSSIFRNSILILLVILKRYREHYKSLYRLSWIFLRDPYFKSYYYAKNYLVEKLDTNNVSFMTAPGLFHERTKQNLFNGIWRMHTCVPHDLERPGSFSAAMSKAVELLIEIFTNSPTELIRLSKVLFVKPDNRNKFLNEKDRTFLCHRAYFEASRSLTESLAKPVIEVAVNNEYENSVLAKAYSLWTFGTKSLDIKDSDVHNALFKAYKCFTGLEETNLETIVKFCQHKRT